MSIKVVDLSSNNGWVDLSKLKQAGCQAVIIKATEGTNYTNPYFDSQVKQAIKLGLKIGAYHFAKGTNAIVEINHYYSVVKPYLKYIGKHYLDYEGSNIVLGGPYFAQKALAYMAQKLGTKPGIYMGLSDENSWNWNGVTSYPLWVAQYNNYNPSYGFHPRSLYGSLRHWSKLLMFQYSASTSLAGYYPLDASIYYGDDWSIGGKSILEGDDKILSIKIAVPLTVKYGVVVSNLAGAQLYSDSALTQPIKGRVLKYKSTWKGFDLQAGAVNVGGSQWVDGRDCVIKLNPFALSTSSTVHGICQIADANTYGQPTADKFAKGYTHFAKGGTYKVFGRTDKYLQIGAGNNKFVDGDKVNIVL